ncbi:ATP-binding protein [Streptomonospora wellingtoniae]|uniref:ATP-binding protein n=1 Tax=Streptomonospora wellingtoniae TaxID=3075544 RepID=A0ABU2KXD0_9ACTN|nr:ATP-binding protein [Streptomonospora sp. DSM 45055]MDT0303955.1 ATP-binding protein [Streptomonospora sp. DSM 45055]
MSRVVLLPHAASSVTSARRRLCSDLRDCGLDNTKVDDAAIVLSELLSNALRHACCLPDPFPPGCVEVSWELGDASTGGARSGWLEVSVRDGGAQTLPRLARPSLSGLGGRGLGIVEHIAAKWGTEVDDRITTVWAVLEAAPEQPEPAADAPHERASGTPGTATVPRSAGRAGERISAVPPQQAARA